MRINSNNRRPLRIDDDIIEQVEKFQYLGGIVSQLGVSNEELRKGPIKLNKQMTIWGCKELRLRTKLIKFKINPHSSCTVARIIITWRQTVDKEMLAEKEFLSCLLQIMMSWTEK